MFLWRGVASQIQCHHKTFLSYLRTSKTENNQWEKTLGFKITTTPVFLRSLHTTGKHARKTGGSLYFIERNSFWRWLLEACWPSDLFHLVYHHPWLKSHVANPAVLLWWKNWVINHCQSYHSSGNSDFSISGHWRITQAQSWLLASLHFKYQHNDSAIMAGLTPGKALPAAFQKEATRIKTALLQRYQRVLTYWTLQKPLKSVNSLVTLC